MVEVIEEVISVFDLRCQSFGLELIKPLASNQVSGMNNDIEGMNIIKSTKVY